VASERSQRNSNYSAMAKVILELAAGWILISALAFVVGFCVVRLLGIKGGEAAPARQQMAGQPQPPGSR
jgi:hypothetical protein